MINYCCTVYDLHAAILIHICNRQTVIALTRQFPIDRVCSDIFMCLFIIKRIAHGNKSTVYAEYFMKAVLEEIICYNRASRIISSAYQQIRSFTIQIGNS